MRVLFLVLVVLASVLSTGPGGAVAFAASGRQSATYPASERYNPIVLVPGAYGSRLRDKNSKREIRITSYNVCYTKLLRAALELYVVD